MTKNTLKQSNWRVYGIIFLFAFVFSFVFGSCPLWGISTKTDSGVFLTIASEMANGSVMYRDIFDHKGPLLYVINFIAYGTGKYIGLWIVEIALLTATMLFSYKTAMLLCDDNKKSLLAVALSYSFLFACIEAGNYTEEYALIFISVGLYYFTKIFTNDLNATKMQVLLLGVSFAGTLLLRANMFGLWAAFCIMLFVLYIYHKRVPELLIAMSFFLIGAALFILPFVVYLLLNNAMEDCLYQVFEFNSKYSSVNYSSLSGFVSFLETFLENIAGVLGQMLVGIPAILVLIWALIEKETTRKLYFVAVFASIVFTVLLVSIAGGVHPHYLMIVVPLLAPIHCALFQHCKLDAIEGSALVKWLLIIVIVGVYSFDNLVCFAEGFLRTEDSQYTEIAQYIEENSDEDDQIIVLGNSCNIYLYANRRPASKYIYQDPITTYDSTIAVEFEQEILEAMPMFIVGAAGTVDDYSEMCLMIEENYQEPIVIGDFCLYQLKGE